MSTSIFLPLSRFECHNAAANVEELRLDSEFAVAAGPRAEVLPWMAGPESAFFDSSSPAALSDCPAVSSNFGNGVLYLRQSTTRRMSQLMRISLLTAIDAAQFLSQHIGFVGLGRN